MKHNSKLNRSRWLLLTLFTLIVGISPAWAGTGDTNFDDVTLVDPTLSYGSIYYGTQLSNGWIVQGGSIYNGGYTGNYFLTSSYKRGSSGLAIDASQSGSQTAYLITPAMSGDVTFWFRSTTSSSTSAWQINVYEATENGESFNIDTTDLIPNEIKHSGKGSQTWTQVTLSNVEGKNLAFKFFRVAIDDFEGNLYVETGCKKPKNLSASNLTINTADISWTKGEDSQDTWQVVYSTDANFDKDAAPKTTVNATSHQITGLSDNTTYYVAVRSYCDSENQSAWTTTSFKTLRAPITSFPWSEDFTDLTSGNIPDGWDNTEGTTSASYKWTYFNSGHTASPCLRFDSYNNYTNNTNFLKTPVMSYAQNAPMQLKFWYKNPKGGDFSVFISNDGGATYTRSLATGLTGASEWTEKVIDLPTDEYYNNVVIVFKGTSNYGSGDAYIYLDDVLVKENAGYAMSISGEDVSENTIAFGEVKNTSTTKTFTISNDGANDLTAVSVISSDAEVFTVSDTDFDIAAGGTKDITVTFVKGVVGSYEETITVSQANVASPIVLSVTGSYATPSAAEMVVKDGEEVIGETVAFGNVGKTKSKTITITNTGEADLNITSITSSNTTDFTVSPSALTVHGGSSETFTVTFVYDAEALNAEKTATITVTASNEGIEAKSFTVTGTRIEQWSEDFSGGTLPDGWENDNSTYWTFTNGVAQSTYIYSPVYYLTTPSLIVEDGNSLSFDACLTVTDSYRYLTVQKQKDNGSWEDCKSISYTEFSNTADNWKTFTIDGLPEGKYKFRFQASGHKLDNFVGFKRNLNDPKMGIYTDAECTVAATTAETKDFGFATTDQTVSYYIKNDGTGTMTLSKGDNPAGFTATLDKTSVAAGEHATLTITMPAADNAGYHSGNIVVTATDLGDFTVSASGVIRDGDKMYLDFSSDNIPSTWTNTSNYWTKNNNGYIETGLNSGTLVSSNLIAEAGEAVVVEAKHKYSGETFTVKYRKAGDEEWSSLISATSMGTSYKMLAGTIEEAGTYELQFAGSYVQIRHFYGLSEPSEPVMVVYDGENVAEASYAFAKVNDESPVSHEFTVKNTGKAKLTGLTAAITGTNADHYEVSISGATGDGNDEIEADAQATITVTQKAIIGTHEAMLTISATGLESKVIALSGQTIDHTILDVDFADNNWPAGWQHGNWTVSYGEASSSTDYSSIVTTPLTVTAGDKLSFDVKRSNSSATGRDLIVRYTTDGGVNWTAYDWSNYDWSATGTLKEQITSSYKTFEVTNIPAGTVAFEFSGKYIKMDNITGDMKVTSAPLMTLTTVSDGISDANLKADGVAEYTLANNGNAEYVGTVALTNVTAAVAGEGVTYEANTLTIPAGKTATITVTMAYAEPYGVKNGTMAISSEGWVGDMVVNYTATTIDPTALYIDFSNNAKPEGWYQIGWSFSDGQASAAYVSNKVLMTQLLTTSGTDNALRFEVKAYNPEMFAPVLKVEYSTDRKTWTEFDNQPSGMTSEGFTPYEVKGLAAGNYYVRFTGSYVYLDNISGWHKVTGIEHDLYVSATTFPATALIPKTVDGVTATATVYSLRANEEGVYAKLFFDETLVATSASQAIDKDDYQNFTLTCDVPATEKTYAAKIVVYYSDNSVAWETDAVDVEVAHTRTLSITEFTRTDGDEALDADENNQISPSFSVTVENTGSTAATPTVKIYQGGNVVATATAAAIEAGETSEAIALTATNMSAGEGGNLAFTAKAFWTAEDLEAKATSASDVVITVHAAAPKFNLNYKGGAALANGDNVDYGLVKAATTKAFTITNSGTAPLELISIDAPEGYSATEVTEGNKNIAIDGSLDIAVTLNAEQGKKSGDLVITYKVDESTNKTFTLHLSGRSVAAGTWTETFDTEIPGAWTNNNWVWNEERQTAYSGGIIEERTLMTPCLTAEKGEVLTYDLTFQYSGYTVKVEYSTDYANWTEYATISDAEAGEQTFVAPAAGDYYLRFTATRYANLDNFVGFKLATTVPVTISQYGYTTFTSMYHINADELPDGIEVFYVKSEGVGGSYVRLTKAEGNIPAGTGLILKGTADEEYNLNIATGATTALEGNLMVGCLEATPLDADASSYVLMNNTDEGRAEFQSLAEYGITILAGKAYLKVPGAGAGARLMIFDDGETTGISSVLRQQARDGRVYNLNGQRVENPKKGQLYIINGKQTVVK